MNRLIQGMLVLCLLAGMASSTFAQTSTTTTTYAAIDYNDYLKSPFTNPQWDPFVQEGFEAMDKNDLVTTIEFLRKSITLGCQSPLVLFKLALCYEAQGSYYSSVQYYELSKEQFQKSNSQHRYRKMFNSNYGRALYMMGETDKAFPILEQAAKEDKSYWICKLLGQISLTKGDLDKAVNYYGQAYTMNDPANTATEQLGMLLELARAYKSQNDLASTQKYYETALKLDPTNKEANDFIRSQQKNNSLEKAMQVLEKN